MYFICAEVLYLDVEGKIILEWILRKLGVKVWIGLIWIRTGTGGGSNEHGIEPLGSIKGREFTD